MKDRKAIKVEIGKTYKIRETDGPGFVYVEVEKPPKWMALKDGEVYVCTRTPYSTSMFCQVETAGTIEVSKLYELDGKKDGEMLKKIREVERRNEMQFYAKETPDGMVHVQNMIRGLRGQHHVHDRASFETWSRQIPKRNLHFEHCAQSCNCGLTRPGDVTEYDGRTWHNDKFETEGEKAKC